MDFYDDDDIEETNLNRQVLFHGCVGQMKAPTLARRLRQLFPRVRASGYGLRLDESRQSLVQHAPLLAACPDSFVPRAMANRWACSQGTMLVNGGTSALGGSCMAYAPRKTPCLSCLIGVDALARHETERVGCTQVEASVVTSNAIVGALMAWQTSQLARGQAESGIWEYDSRLAGVPIGVHSRRPPCRCDGRAA